MKKLLFILLGVSMLSAKAHEYFVSICDIHHNPKEHTLEISFKLITHDLEKAVLLLNGTELHLDSEQEHPKSDAIIMAYMQEHFQLKVNGESVSYRFIGSEFELNGFMYCYLEVAAIDQLQSLEITNSVLTDAFERQVNKINVFAGDFETGTSLHKDKISEYIEFNQ